MSFRLNRRCLLRGTGSLIALPAMESLGFKRQAKASEKVTGGGANLKLGQQIVLPNDTPLCNVWLTMLQGMGIETSRHGDSTKIVRELKA